jgi:hypothetical protein
MDVGILLSRWSSILNLYSFSYSVQFLGHFKLD